MPVHAIIQGDATIAGGVEYGGVFTVTHNQLTGNTEGKRIKLQEALQDILDNRMHEDDIPLDDIEHPDHADNATLGYNIYDDEYTRPDTSLIDEQRFYWKQNNANMWLVHRGILGEIILVTEDHFGAGKHLWSISLRRLYHG